MSLCPKFRFVGRCSSACEIANKELAKNTVIEYVRKRVSPGTAARSLPPSPVQVDRYLGTDDLDSGNGDKEKA